MKPLTRISIALVFVSTLLLGASPAAQAETEDARLVVHIDSDLLDGTHLIGSPVRISVSIVNQKVEAVHAAQVDAWREEVRQIEAAGGGLTPPRPGPVEVTADLLIPLGNSTTEWFASVDLGAEREDGTAVLSDVRWVDHLIFPTEILEGPTSLGRDPLWVTLDLGPEFTSGMEAGRYRLVATSDRWGVASWDLVLRSPEGAVEQAQIDHLRAKRQIALGEFEAASSSAESARATLGAVDPEVYLTHGRALAHLNRLEEAIEAYGLYLRVAGEAPDACYGVEMARLTFEDLKLAVKEGR